MNSRTKNILIGVLLVGIISMTIVYAALSQQLNISGSAKVQSKSESWNIHFQHITTSAGLEATGLKGYSLAKSEEMLNKGASPFDVDDGNVNCHMTSDGWCDIGSNGYVNCNGGSDLDVDSDGSTYGHSAP